MKLICLLGLHDWVEVERKDHAWIEQSAREGALRTTGKPPCGEVLRSSFAGLLAYDHCRRVCLRCGAVDDQIRRAYTREVARLGAERTRQARARMLLGGRENRW